MAYTQADLDALEQELKTLRQRVEYGDKSVTNFDIDQQIKRISYVRAQVQAASATPTYSRAGFSRE